MTKDMIDRETMDEDYIARFLERGGNVTKLAPKHRVLKTEKAAALCQKCESDVATKKFSDGDGNQYYWCAGCYDE